MKHEDLKEIGPQIKEIRISKGLTQQQLAEKSDLSLPFINLIENNKRNIFLETLIKLLDVLDISIGDFFLPYSENENENEELKILLKKLRTLPNKDEYY